MVKKETMMLEYWVLFVLGVCCSYSAFQKFFADLELHLFVPQSFTCILKVFRQSYKPFLAR